MSVIIERRKQILREAWADLTLDILVPAEWPEELIDAVVNNNRRNTNPHFRGAFPVVVARFKDAAYEEIYNYAKNIQRGKHQSSINEFNEAKGQKFREAWDIMLRYERDIRKIHQVLWGNDEVQYTSTVCEMGRFKKPRSQRVHADYVGVKEFKKSASYVARIGALPFEYIKMVDGIHMPSDIREALAAASEVGGLGKPARRILRNRGVLVPADLGAVLMMLGGKNGTLHASCENSPAGGVHSVFLRSINSFQLRPD